MTELSSKHWSQLDTEDQIRFWQGIDEGSVDSSLTEPVRKPTKRRRGDHSTKPKCENPSWFRPASYKTLGGQLGYAYNRLVKRDKATGAVSLRMRMSLHPFYVKERKRAGRKYAFRPEKRLLLDTFWPTIISFCDAGKHTSGMCVSRLAREISPKDGKGNVIPETAVTVSRMSRLIDEQVAYGTLGVSEEKAWDRESKSWLPKYVHITEVGFRMLGVDMQKLLEQQKKRLKESEERRALVADGILDEDEELSPHAARKRWYAQKSLEALRFRRQQGASSKRANRLARLPRDAQIYEMSPWVLKTMPADEAYWCTPERLEQLELALAPPA